MLQHLVYRPQGLVRAPPMRCVSLSFRQIYAVPTYKRIVLFSCQCVSIFLSAPLSSACPFFYILTLWNPAPLSKSSLLSQPVMSGSKTDFVRSGLYTDYGRHSLARMAFHSIGYVLTRF